MAAECELGLLLDLRRPVGSRGRFQPHSLIIGLSCTHLSEVSSSRSSRQSLTVQSSEALAMQRSVGWHATSRTESTWLPRSRRSKERSAPQTRGTGRRAAKGAHLLSVRRVLHEPASLVVLSDALPPSVLPSSWATASALSLSVRFASSSSALRSAATGTAF